MNSADWQQARHDLAEALSRRWLWSALGWNDVRLRYSGSRLGSFWITANIALMALCLTYVFAAPLGVSRGGYAAYVTIGLVLWYFIQLGLNEAANVFVTAADTIRNLAMPLSVHVLRLVWRNLLVLAHNAVIVPIVLLVFGIAPGPLLWSVAPALLLLAVNFFFVALLLGMLGARFRDVPQIVTNLLQLLFFLTPIFWLPSVLPPERGWVVAINPIFAFIDIVRAPLLGAAAAPTSWPVALAVTAAAAAAGSIGFAAFRARVSYWI